jgi:hypothetical protein
MSEASLPATPTLEWGVGRGIWGWCVRRERGQVGRLGVRLMGMRDERVCFLISGK